MTSQHFRHGRRPNPFSLRHEPPKPPRIALPLLACITPGLVAVLILLLEVTR